MYDYILQFDDSVKAIEQEKGELAGGKVPLPKVEAGTRHP